MRVLQGDPLNVGGTKTLHVDIRLVAASNCDLEQEVAAGKFRRDLFYRLNVVPLVLPPLRAQRRYSGAGNSLCPEGRRQVFARASTRPTGGCDAGI